MSSEKPLALKGIFQPIPTPFTASGDVSFGNLQKNIEKWNAQPLAGTVTNTDGAVGFLFSHQANDSFKAINRLQASDHEVYWLTQPVTTDGVTHAEGTFYVKSHRKTVKLLGDLAANLGIHFRGIGAVPTSDALRLRSPRVALWDIYGGSMPSGWIRWILEQFEYADVDIIYPQQLHAGHLKDDYDVIIFPNGAIGSQFEDFVAGATDSNRQTELRREFGPRSPDRELIPEEYQGRLGRVTPEATLSPLKNFLEEGGSIVTIGGSTALGKALGLPLKNQLVKDGQRLGREEYYVPGSILSSRVDNSRLVASGVPTDLPVSFNNSPVFNRTALQIGDTDEIA